MRVLSTKLKYLYCILVDFNARATVTRLQQTYILYGRELRVLTGRLRLSAILKNSFSAWFALVVDCVRALTAIVGACLVAYAMRVLSTKLKSILYLGGLHCPCDYDSFTASL